MGVQRVGIRSRLYIVTLLVSGEHLATPKQNHAKCTHFLVVINTSRVIRKATDYLEINLSPSLACQSQVFNVAHRKKVNGTLYAVTCIT